MAPPRIGRQIRRARLNAGLTQAAFARRCGIAGRTVRAWEAGHTHPRPSSLARICDATGHTMSFFTGDHAAARDLAHNQKAE